MGMTYHKVFELWPLKSGLAFNSGYSKGFSRPLLQWQKFGKSLSSDSRSDSGVVIHPPAQLLVAKSTKERRISVGCLQLTKTDILHVPHIQKLRKLRSSSPTHATTIARLKVIQRRCTVLKDSTEMGLLTDNCTLAYPTAGRLVGCVTHILTMHCQTTYKNVLANKQFYSMFILLESAIQQGNFKV